MTTEQRRALADTTPTTEVIRDAVTFPGDRLGEPLGISPERFDAWLAQIKLDAAREALDSYIEYGVKHAQKWSTPPDAGYFRDAHYPEDVTP